ncbi:MAG TPA: aldose 1-epimerase [Allosphingosinicella sp.]|nr:aldose 1-epimerase [Allosphingosinicella sp.]
MTAGTLLRLAAGPLELWISPTAGGSIARFDWLSKGNRKPILRGCEGVPSNVLEAANFPLVPFVNRIRGGKFRFRDREISLAPNLEGDPSPLHGQGWLAPWRIEARTENELDLAFTHPSGEWPWSYEARQNFRLDEGGLSLRLDCRNLSDEPMPCGLGQHPYFPCTSETRLDTRVSHAWTIDEHVLPVEKVSATGRYDLRNRAVCGQDLDHGFGGWGGTARITDPGLPFEIHLSSPQARFFQLYSPPGGGLFVAEPVSHANAAMNAPEEEWAELGFEVLEPGEAMTLDARLDVREAR